MKILSRSFLPKEHNSVHAASLCFHKDGYPVFSWFEGPREGHPEVFIRIYNLRNNNDSILIGHKDSIARWNPILFSYDQRMYLFEKSGEFCDRWQTFFHDITDWDSDVSYKQIYSNAQVLPAGLNASVKTKPIIVDSKIYCGSSVETIYDWTSYIECYSLKNKELSLNFRTSPLFVDKIKYLSRYTNMPSKTLGIIQPALWITEANNKKTMHAFMRSSYGHEKIHYSRSIEDNNSPIFYKWEKPKPIDIPNPNSSVDVVYTNNRLFLVCNPVTFGRLPLSIFELNDKMEIIDQLNVTENVDAALISPEASYPYMIENQGKLHLVYTYGRAKIEHVVIEI